MKDTAPHDRSSHAADIGDVREQSSRPRQDPCLLGRSEIYLQILDAIDDMVLVKGEGSRIVWANKAFRDYYGMSNEQLSSIIDASFNEEENTAQYIIDDRFVFETGKTLHIDAEPVTRHDGQVNLFSTVKSAIRDADGRVVLTVGVSRDITEKRRIEAVLEQHRETLETLVAERTAALRDTTERLEAVIGSLVEGVIAVDSSDRITLLNPAAEQLLDRKAADSLGLPFSELVPLTDENEDRPLANGNDLRLLARRTRKSGRVVARLKAPNGQARIVSVTVSPQSSQEEAYSGAVCILRDMTNEREAENRHIRHQRLESLGLLAGGIAHDFNNILMGILGNISLCRTELHADTEVARTLEQAEHACARAQGLARQLLTFAKGGAPIKRVIDTEPVVREAAKLALRGSAIELEIRAEPGLHPIEADENQLDQAISNLVLNAKQAMPSGGLVTITLENARGPAHGEGPAPRDGFVKITVEDNGPGIAAEHLHRVFDPYFTTKETGSGLGLASVHSIVSRHGGQVNVSSPQGKGARFSLYLPAAANAVPARQPTRDIRTGVARRLLVLDDDTTVRTVLKSMLVRLGHQVTVTASSAELFAAFDADHKAGTPPDAVFVDLTMPGDLSGEEVIARLRARTPDVRVIVMTGYTTSHLVERPTELGLHAALAKPFNLDALKEALAKL